MDAVSYSLASKQAQRIEKFIENPDSTSGIVTVPKVIASGETITIPAGRVAVLPNVQVDGTLNVEGEVFIPSGSGLSTVVQKSGDTMSGNLNFASGTKITGDFSNATPSSRVSFQSSTVNGNTIVSAKPNGTGTQSMFICESTSDAGNCQTMNIHATTIDTKIVSAARGTGSYVPMLFVTGGTERMRIDTVGNLLLTSGTGALGYGTGSGGTVTQLTNKSTAVTLNKPTGQITMNNAALAAGASAVFAFNNSLIEANDIVIPYLIGGGIGINYTTYATGGTAGYVGIWVTNKSGGSLSEALIIQFVIIKGAIA